jgi:glyoxylase-like metal-dependent hydrolase (beta-lactamase superfamily II)
MPEPELHWEDERAEIHRVVVGALDNNVFVLRCKASGAALLVDAADEGPLLVRMCRDLGVKQVVETHGHHDHIQAVPAVREARLPVWVREEDAGRLPGHDGLLEDDEVIEVGELRVRTIHTPGHTPGSICFRVEGSPVLFSGDTLFPGGPGATRFPGGDFPTIIRSIRERLFTLGDEVVVMPGHGADTTIGTERPQLQEWIDRGW